MDKLTTNDIVAIINDMCDVIITNEVYFCELDSIAGDGDFGMSLAKGFKVVKAEWDNLSKEDIGTFLKDCGMIITEHCGGASGPIWGTAFRTMGKNLAGKTEIDAAGYAYLLQSWIEGVQKRGGAKLGDKTLLDAVIPAAEAAKASADAGEDVISAMKKAGEAAKAGAEKTKDMVASRGRATYVGERSLSFPDAGAMGIGIIFTEIAERQAKRV